MPKYKKIILTNSDITISNESMHLGVTDIFHSYSYLLENNSYLKMMKTNGVDMDNMLIHKRFVRIFDDMNTIAFNTNYKFPDKAFQLIIYSKKKLNIYHRKYIFNGCKVKKIYSDNKVIISYKLCAKNIDVVYPVRCLNIYNILKLC